MNKNKLYAASLMLLTSTAYSMEDSNIDYDPSIIASTFFGHKAVENGLAGSTDLRSFGNAVKNGLAWSTYVTSQTGYPALENSSLSEVRENCFGAPTDTYHSTIDENEKFGGTLESIISLSKLMAKNNFEYTEQLRELGAKHHVDLLKHELNLLELSADNQGITLKTELIALECSKLLSRSSDYDQKIDSKKKEINEAKAKFTLKMEEKKKEIEEAFEEVAKVKTDLDKKISIDPVYALKYQAIDKGDSLQILPIAEELFTYGSEEPNKMPLFNCDSSTQLPIKVTSHVIKDLIEKNPDKKVDILTLFDSPGHHCAARVTLDNGAMKVEIYEPDILEKLSPSEEYRTYFEQIANEAGLELDYSCYPLGHQIVNMQDCSRFSLVYLLALADGKDPRDLSSHDVYKGFEFLKSRGLKEETVSKFAKGMNVLRWPARKILQYLD